MDHSSPLWTRGAPPHDSTRPTDRLALGSALLAALLVAGVLTVRALPSANEPHVSSNLLEVGTDRQPSRPQVGAQPAGAQPTVATSPTQAAALTPSAPAPERLHVGHTDGQGVVLRASPNEWDRTPRGFMDGDAVIVLEQSGPDWARVRGDNGQEGWVPAHYLSP